MVARRRRRVAGRRGGSRRSGRRVLQTGQLALPMTGGFPALNRRVRIRNVGVARRNTTVGMKRAMRNRLPSQTLTKRRKTSRSMALKCADFDRRRVTFGRKKPVSKMTIARMSIPYRVLRFQGFKQFQDPNAEGATANVFGGSYPMEYIQNFTPGAPTATATQFPLYLLDLTASVNAEQYPAALHKFCIAGSGMPYFISTNGNTPGGTGSIQYQLESTNVQSSAWDDARALIQPSWHSINFVLYGARKQPTEFEFMLVRPTDSDYDPIQVNNNNVNTTTGQFQNMAAPAADEYSSFWAQMVRPMVSNPISYNAPRGRTRPGGGVFKILKRWKVGIPCAMNTEVDASPNSRILKMFIRDGRVLNYQWSADDLAYSAANTTADDDIWNTSKWRQFQGTSGNTHTHPRYKARTYLIIRSLNYVANLPSAGNADVTPSFDLLYRRKEYLGDTL